MGRLYYGNTTDAIELPDRMLAHLKVVASTKLRRSESFTVSWMDKSDAARGRATIWLHCSIPLRFEFDSADAEAIDRAYLERLAHEASSSAGIVFDLSTESSPRALSPAAELASTLRRAA